VLGGTDLGDALTGANATKVLRAMTDHARPATLR